MNENASEAEAIRCPTCSAQQVASDECRRCKCDMSLVLAVRDRARRMHHECLRHLRTGAYRDALHSALCRHELSPDETSRRLLAVAAW